MVAFLASQPSLRADRRALAHALFDEDDLAWSPNFALLLTRAQSALAAHSELPLLSVTPDDVGLCAPNLQCDVKAFAAATQRARQERDSLAACAFWQEALDLARATPFSDLDHPLLSPIRSQLQGTVLEALECLATGPLGQKHAPLILDRLAEFGFQRTPSSHRVQALMRIYAALGLKEEVVQTFSAYEAHLDDDCGERVPSVVSNLFESLLAGMDRPLGRRWGIAPEGQPMVGRREHLAALIDLVRSDCGRCLTTLTGQSGIGKSHLLRVLFWRISPLAETAHFDFEMQPPDLVARLLTESACEVVLLDHVEAEHRHTVEQLLRSHPEARFVCASRTRLGLPGEGMMTLGPLELGDPCNPGPAIELLVRNLERVVDPKGTGSPDVQLFELAELCDGIPMALEIAGRLGGSIGVAATISSLRRNLDALTSDRGSANRRSSLRNAIESSYRNLGSQAQDVVTLIAGLGGRCHIDHLLECCGAMPCDLEEGLLSGLVSRDGTTSYVRVLRSTAAALTSVSEPGSLSDLFRGFREKSVDWFARRGEETPLDLQIADSLPVALEIVGQMIDEGAGDRATLLFASIRPWLGSAALGTSQLQAIDRFLLVEPQVEAPGWLAAVLSLSAAYFHAGAFDRMRELVRTALELAPERATASDLRCQLTMQAGLAERALGHPEVAIERYRLALGQADEKVAEPTLVKCYYNLGTLLESQERLEEALAAQEAASDHFSPATDPRVESLVNTCIGRLRYRLDADLDSAGLILEATLAHARERNDLRATGEILQNLGQIAFERKHYAKAALSEAVGTLFLLDFGYNEEFRRLAKSSMVTLCASLFELGFDEEARTTRTLIDRLGAAPLYAPNQRVFERLEMRTFKQPPNLKVAMASEREVKDHLLRCVDRLRSLPSADQAGEWLSVMRSVVGAG